MNTDSDNLKCDQCSGDSDQLFHCETCSDSDQDSELKRRLLCDICVGPHTKQGHSITDLKGYEPVGNTKSWIKNTVDLAIKRFAANV